LAIRKNENKIQTFFIPNRVKPGICLKRFGFYKGLDNSRNPNVWISCATVLQHIYWIMAQIFVTFKGF